tara:strand:+ start:57200 stop:57622 length:423 start_codon:yes stop_codon:yes gene_type:complete
MSESTERELFDAITRIQSGTPIRVEAKRKLSAKAVEEEAGVGLSTAYHYPSVIQRIKDLKNAAKQKAGQATPTQKEKYRSNIKEQEGAKERYREERDEYKAELDKSVTREANLVYQLWVSRRQVSDLESQMRHANVVALR